MRFQIFKREDLLAMTDRQKVDDFSVQPIDDAIILVE
jgi:hypothetical protein